MSLFKGLKPIVYGGREVWPLVEGGKGVAVSNHASSGAWAAAGGIGTVSAVNADSYDAEGNVIPQIYRAATRKERHQELIQYAIDGAFPDGQRSWTYSIEAPTEKLTVRFDFSRSVLPSQFSVSHRIGQSLFPEPTPPQLAGSVYVWTKLLPTYKDTYEFAFEWGA